MNKDNVNKLVLLLLVIFISLVFLFMIRLFLMPILLAGIFSAFVYPVYRWFEKKMGGRRRTASLICLVLLVSTVLLPLTGLLTIVAAEAVKVGQSVTPWVQQWISEPTAFSEYLESIPYYEELAPYKELIFTKAGEAVSRISMFLFDNLSAATLGTVNFILMLFVFLYTMYFFLIEGDLLLEKILYYLPLEDKDEKRILSRFTSVTRATLKGTAVIGVVQGAAAGMAFAVAGVPSSVFWGAIMAVLSIIPGVGSALVWFPASVILVARGHVTGGIMLLLFCGLVVGSLDNLLRPRLVGRDTQLHELMIFFSTMGGITFFGIIGFIIGPIVAALFVTLWEIYGVAFREVLPDVGKGRRGSRPVKS